MKTKNEEFFKTIGDGSAICGGVVNESMMKKDPWTYMMAYYLQDDIFELYKVYKEKGEHKKAKELFDRHARSGI